MNSVDKSRYKKSLGHHCFLSARVFWSTYEQESGRGEVFWTEACCPLTINLRCKPAFQVALKRGLRYLTWRQRGHQGHAGSRLGQSQRLDTMRGWIKRGKFNMQDQGEGATPEILRRRVTLWKRATEGSWDSLENIFALQNTNHTGFYVY